MNASQNHQRFNTGPGPFSLPLPRRICSRAGEKSARAFLLFLLGCVSFLGGVQPVCAENKAQNKAPNEEPNEEPALTTKKGVATFVQPPDPSTIPAALPLPPEPSGPSSLDLLPSFPPGPSGPEADFLDLVMKKRQNPSLVPDGPNPTEDAALALDKRYRYQTARVHALNDPDIQEALAASKKARTDRELRAAMHKHYALLFAKMRKLDPSLEALIKERETAALGPLEEKMIHTAKVPVKK